MAKRKEKVEVINEIEEIREEMQSNDFDFEEVFKKEFGCNLYLKSIITRRVKEPSEKTIKALRLIKMFDKVYEKGDFLVLVEKMLVEVEGVI